MIAYWPFCVAASRSTDYTMIAAPDFLVEAGDVDFFRNRAFRLTEAMDTGEIVSIELENVPGAFVCAYRAAATLVAGEQQYDIAGRPLFHAIGFIAAVPDLDEASASAVYTDCFPAMSAHLQAFIAMEHSVGGPLVTGRREFAGPLRNLGS